MLMLFIFILAFAATHADDYRISLGLELLHFQLPALAQCVGGILQLVQDPVFAPVERLLLLRVAHRIRRGLRCLGISWTYPQGHCHETGRRVWQTTTVINPSSAHGRLTSESD